MAKEHETLSQHLKLIDVILDRLHIHKHARLRYRFYTGVQKNNKTMCFVDDP